MNLIEQLEKSDNSEPSNISADLIKSVFNDLFYKRTSTDRPVRMIIFGKNRNDIRRKIQGWLVAGKNELVIHRLRKRYGKNRWRKRKCPK